MLCAVGKVGKVERNVAIFVAYIPPTMRTPELERLKELLAVESKFVGRYWTFSVPSQGRALSRSQTFHGWMAALASSEKTE